MCTCDWRLAYTKIAVFHIIKILVRAAKSPCFRVFVERLREKEIVKAKSHFCQLTRSFGGFPWNQFRFVGWLPFLVGQLVSEFSSAQWLAAIMHLHCLVGNDFAALCSLLDRLANLLLCWSTVLGHGEALNSFCIRILAFCWNGSC